MITSRCFEFCFVWAWHCLTLKLTRSCQYLTLTLSSTDIIWPWYFLSSKTFEFWKFSRFHFFEISDFFWGGVWHYMTLTLPRFWHDLTLTLTRLWNYLTLTLSATDIDRNFLISFFLRFHFFHISFFLRFHFFFWDFIFFEISFFWDLFFFEISFFWDFIFYFSALILDN